jgi:RNA polymerase sigma factor (sigma-70 family)
MEDPKEIEKLLIKAKNGDKKAEDEIFSFLNARFMPIVQHRIWDSAKDADTIKMNAEDIVQNALVTISEKFNKINYDVGFFNWACGVLRNKIGDYYNQGRTKTSKNKPFDEHDPTKKDQIEGDLYESELENNIIKSLKKLGPDCQKIFLVILKGYALSDVRGMFKNISRGTFDSKISRCRQSLKNMLQEGGYL